MREHPAVGMLEYTSIAAGIKAADTMVKTSEVRALFFRTICPGKFLAAITGDVAAVEASVQAGREVSPEVLADWFVIPNIHSEVIMALAGCVPVQEKGALGVIETFSAASAVLAADQAVKSADVRLLEVRMALGLGGKGYILLTGDVAAVQAAVDAGADQARANGLLVGITVLPRPDDALIAQLI